MKEIALLHTVRTVVDTFGPALTEYLGGDVKLYNQWDEFLAVNPNEVGEFTLANKNRLFLDLKAAEMTGADLILVTCSTLTPHLNAIRKFVGTPIVAIDDAMTKKAVACGEKILVLATAESTVQGTVDKVYEDAAAAGKKVTVESMVVTEAFFAMKANDMETHDRLVRLAVKDLKGYDCVVLAQASMAHLKSYIQGSTGITTLSSPRLCMEQVKEMLETT